MDGFKNKFVSHFDDMNTQDPGLNLKGQRHNSSEDIFSLNCIDGCAWFEILQYMVGVWNLV